MKRTSFRMHIKLSLIILVVSLVFYSCEKDLESVTFSRFSTDTFFTNADDAKAAVTASYRGLRPVWGSNHWAVTTQSTFMGGELICSWGWAGWKRFNDIDLSEDFGNLTGFYNTLMPNISEITMNIHQIGLIDMDEDLKERYIAELKGLRAMYSQTLFELYGPSPIRIDPEEAGDPNAEPIPRPTSEWMIAQIEKDYNDAAAVLPARFTGDDYGRITSTACYHGLMQLYMNLKRWDDAILMGRQIMTMGYELIPTYDDNFTMEAKGGNSEIIFALPTRSDAASNAWLAHAMTSNYVDPSGMTIMAWGGYKMPWDQYDRFDPSDSRLARLFAEFPTFGGETFDARAEGWIGALPMKYGPDPDARSASHGVDIVGWRYANVLLYLAEAINEVQGPTSEAYELINTVRRRAGVDEYVQGTHDKDQFRELIMDERFFELWAEGFSRNDRIRWGNFIQRAIDAGSAFAKPEFVLYPLPREAITESEGVVKQNPGY